MKTLIIKATFLLAFMVHAMASYSQVFVDGIVYSYSKDNKPVQITIMEDDQFYKSMETNKAGKFRVRLQPNHYYMINFSKPDHYVTKIAVDTKVPFETDPEFFTEIPLKADLVRKYVDMDPAVMKKPLSIFSYNPATKTFMQDDEYLKKARAQLEAFLYEAEEAEKRGKEGLAAKTPEKSVENVDSLRQAREREQEKAKTTYLQNTGTSNSGYEGADEKSDDKGESNNVKKEATAQNNSNKKSGPSATEPVNETADQQNDTVAKISADTVPQLTAQSDVETYAVTIKVNGKEYDPMSDEKISVNNELDIDIIGIDERAYSLFSFKLEGFDNSFIALNDDELEYDEVADGQYTFILKSSNQAHFKEMRVPLLVEKDSSEFPWWMLIGGAVVIALIFFFIARRKDEDHDKLSEVEARHAAEARRKKETNVEVEAGKERKRRDDIDHRREAGDGNSENLNS